MYTDFFSKPKTENFIGKILIFSSEYPQSTFWSKNMKKIGTYTPAYPNFAIYIYISVVQDVYMSRTCFPDGCRKSNQTSIQSNSFRAFLGV